MLTVLALAALIQTADPTPPECVDAITTPQVNACAAAEVERDREVMNRYFAAAIARVREEAEDAGRLNERSLEENLAASQADWERYAESACAAVYHRWSGGTIRTVMALGCMGQLVRQRTHNLWRDYLTYPDSTPPILPEPAL